MADADGDRLHELRRALERLVRGLYAATHAEGAREDRADDAYRRHGAPFGPTPEAAHLWSLFAQFTTPN